MPGGPARWLSALALAMPCALRAQVALAPTTTAPAAWERFALRVANPTDTPTVAVAIRLPDGVTVMGVDAPPGWTGRFTAATDTSPQTIEWTGGTLAFREFREFAFFGRVAPNLRTGDLVFPVRITRVNGTTVNWAPGGAGVAPTVRVRAVTTITPAAAFTLAAFALGTAVVAVAMAVARRSRR
ncbi:MAG TPA: DUF1775 domain-containing protein [Gemmatimonadales bacterium]|nr:DUF1775 domain-containing protein [Gemmatimonadales bacterium]